jgi:CheY-like chemotaxis protein
VLVAEADPATRELLGEWLGGEGWQVVDEASAAAGLSEVALAVVDVPHPRGGGIAAVQRVRAQHAGVPILAISPSFLPNVQPCGACARLLGVQRVLPKPLSREDLIGAVKALLATPAG